MGNPPIQGWGCRTCTVHMEGNPPVQGLEQRGLIWHTQGPGLGWQGLFQCLDGLGCRAQPIHTGLGPRPQYGLQDQVSGIRPMDWIRPMDSPCTTHSVYKAKRLGTTVLKGSQGTPEYYGVLVKNACTSCTTKNVLTRSDT